MVATDCSIPRCSSNGYCVVPVDTWVCHCFEGWSGDDCSVGGTATESPGGSAASLSTAAVAGIVIALLLLLSESMAPHTLTSRRDALM